MLTAPNLGFVWLNHGFGFRDSEYPLEIVQIKQVHSATVIDASEARNGFVRQADALVTNQAGIVVGVRTADCVPILIADERTHAVAAVHAGWRGSAQNIARAAVEALATRFGSRPGDLHAAIGPAIGVCCYEVGAEVARQFGTWAPEYANAAEPIKIDLGRVNAAQLREAGVADIWVSDECTYCDPRRYFSFRREKEQAGRLTSFIGSR